MSTVYTPEIADIICARVAQGMTVAQAIRGIGYPTLNEWYAWLRDTPELQVQYAIAKEDKGATLIDEALQIADECDLDPVAVNKARLQIDTRKWIASKFAPKSFGEKLDVEHSGGFTLIWPLPPHPLELKRARDLELEHQSSMLLEHSSEGSTSESSAGASSSPTDEPERLSPA